MTHEPAHMHTNTHYIHTHTQRLVGGAVRDLLMGVAPKDYDFATNATPDTVKAILEQDGIHVIETGVCV